MYDLVAPYLLRGAPLGPIHAAISAIYVHDYDISTAEEAIVIRGVARFSGEIGGYYDLANGELGTDGENVEGHLCGGGE